MTETGVMPLRLQIAAMLADNNPDAVGELPGFCVIKDKSEVFGDCSCYVFCNIFALGMDNMWEAYLSVVRKWQRVEEPLPGDLVIYYQQKRGSPQHFGLFVADGIVESKFGYAHVYRHPLVAVPEYYGTILRFYRREKKKRKQKL